MEVVGKFRDRDKCLKTLNGDLTTLDFCRLLKTELMFQINMYVQFMAVQSKRSGYKIHYIKVKDFKGLL